MMVSLRYSLGRTVQAALLAGLAACADLQSERHIAPIFTELSMAGGGREVEALGGAILVRHPELDGKPDYQALRPLYSWHQRTPLVSRTWVLPPLGSATATPTLKVTQFLPIFRFAERTPVDGPASWLFFSLPGIIWAKTPDGRTVRGWFPIGGVIEGTLSFDRAWWVLWPLYSGYERAGRKTQNVLWPFFSATYGAGGPSWCVWPLIGVNHYRGRYERWYFLWPFFHWQHNRIARDQDEVRWFFWPFFGYRTAGPARSWTFLWPFFGYTRNTQTGFWAWDGPWPFVRLQDPGDTDQASIMRLWPLYTSFRANDREFTSRWALWPFFHWRSTERTGIVQRSQHVLPFWRSWEREVDGEFDASWRKLWPVYRSASARGGDERFFAFPALNPFMRLQVIDEHYAWLWEIYARQTLHDRVRVRSLLGLWRREKDEDEDRRSFVGLWARRDYSLAGEPVRETSLLFGLIRWRSWGGRVRLLAPALPGPGWPLERVPNSLPVQPAADSTGAAAPGGSSPW
ncbi:MAG: hypothetical protein V3T22_06985 [Planctomycetota bacterium]